MCHYDTLKGGSKQYNYANGLIRSEGRELIEKHKHRIPVYDHYKSMFESCDRFNRQLHDKTWPIKGAGRKFPAKAACITTFCWLAFCKILSMHITLPPIHIKLLGN